MSTTLPLQIGHRKPPANPHWLATLGAVANSLGLSSTRGDAARLLRLADRYEATQPSYAADLRAAACHALESR